MDPLTQRWQQLENDRSVGVPALRDPTVMTPACGGLRVRREYAARDAINSRAWDFFHATPPTRTSSENLARAPNPVYMDMNPISARNNTVQYRNQMEYMPDPPRAATTAADLGIAPRAGAVAAPPSTYSTNPYLQRMDVGGSEARNVIRELRSAVVEDNRERATDTDRYLAERQFSDRWLPPVAAADAASLQAYELLKPRVDDWRSMRNTGGSS